MLKTIVDSGVIALVGAGKGGLALLKVLLNIPGVKVKYVCDINPGAVGVLYAENHNIKYLKDYKEIIADEEINLIFEATGIPYVLEDLSSKKPHRVSIVGGDGSRIIYNLLDSYNAINRSLNEYKINLEKKIIERTEELEKANENLEKEMLEYEKISHKLQEMNTEKTKYLLYATHQLKAPFAAIQSYVDLMLEGYSGDLSQQTRDIIIKIKQRCELLSNVIKEMLELAKLKSRDAAYIEYEKIDIFKTLGNIVKGFKVIAGSREIKIDYKRGDDSPFIIFGNEKQIEILFSVLLENALHYSPSGTTITVVCKKLDNNQLSISIRDQGIGIPKKNIANIFNEFFRSNNAVEFHKNGTGLGLSIAKEIAEIHNTNINIESEVGKGSCFSMIFHAS